MPSPPSQRPLWTRLLPTLSDGQVPPLLASLLPLLAPPIATMGMGAASSHSDLTTLHQQALDTHPVVSPSASSATTVITPSPTRFSAPSHEGSGHTLVFGSTLKSCAVCLEDYRPGDRLRLLDPCGHCFHLACVDEWFNAHIKSAVSHFDCPVCKTPIAYRRPTKPEPSLRRALPSSDPPTHVDHPSHVNPPDAHARQPWAHIQLIDLSVHQSWVDWFSELVHLYSTNAATPRRRV